MSASSGGWELVAPDGADERRALSRTTDLAVVAHPDDLELLLPGPIGDCAQRSDRWFTGVVVTNGAGSLGVEGAPTGSAALVERRAAEQRAAAGVGRHSVVLLGQPSDALATSEGRRAIEHSLVSLVERCAPDIAYTHALTDRHRTHVAVAVAAIGALRTAADDATPRRLLGVEGWRDLDWLADDDKVLIDTSAHGPLADRMAACFESQLAHKAYDRAARGRRRANATLGSPRSPDRATEVTTAMDLTACLDPTVDLVRFVTDLVDRMRDEAVDTMTHALRPSR